MRRPIARSLLRRFEERYDYDTTYMREMLEHAPGAFFAFAKIQPVSRYRRVTPEEAYYAVKVLGAIAEDCGPCTQLAVNMAREAGVDEHQIAAVLSRDVAAMSENTAAGFRFARAVLDRDAGSLDEEERARDAVRELWGEAGLIELALALAIGRVFPMLKNAMGHGRACGLVRVGAAPVEVARLAG